METEQNEKNLELERLVFFSDAVVAIAITLLALDLSVKPAGAHLTFTDIGQAWHRFAAFFLSFIVIAVFWINHHRFFVYIKAIDSKLMVFNICWLLFIVLLPFTSSLTSNDFFNKPAMLMYSANILIITCLQNMIWDYASDHRELLKDTITAAVKREYRIGSNLAMVNAAFAVAITFLSPLLAFITLFARIFMFRRSAQQYLAHLTQRKAAKGNTDKRGK